jgi:hypothetical protein
MTLQDLIAKLQALQAKMDKDFDDANVELDLRVIEVLVDFHHIEDVYQEDYDLINITKKILV